MSFKLSLPIIKIEGAVAALYRRPTIGELCIKIASGKECVTYWHLKVELEKEAVNWISRILNAVTIETLAFSLIQK